MSEPRSRHSSDTDEQILELLRAHADHYLSGEEICRRFGVSRTAVWKRIKSLRSLGYEIEASRRLGYQLVQSPDLLLPSEVKFGLKTRWMGKTLHHYEALDSTNSEAYQRALGGAQEGEIVIAESQRKGRGRLGRPWVSPPGVNLYLSVILRPDLPPHQASLVTLMAAVATAEALEQYSGLRPAIKWPNDILLGNRKVAGLLNEINSESDRIHFIILGIGVNLNMDERQLPEDVRPVATSLKQEMGQGVSRKLFLQELLVALEKWYGLLMKDGGVPVLEAWREWARISGREIKVTSFGKILSGRAVDIDSDGTLLLEMENGELTRIVAGDVAYAGENEKGRGNLSVKRTDLSGDR